MLDFDLARLYGVQARQLKRQARRNADRFPEDFMFVLTQGERAILRCQTGTLRWGAHSKYLPYAFTEEGVAMLSGVLKSGRAVRVNIAIMRAFVRLRRVLNVSKEFTRRLDRVERRLLIHGARLRRHAKGIGVVFSEIRRLMEPPEKPKERIGFVPGDKP